MRAPALVPIVLACTCIVAAQAGPIEYIYFLRDQRFSATLPDAELLRRQDQIEASCRFETHKAAASAGNIVVPGTPGVPSRGRPLDNLASALTATAPTVLPGMTRPQAWDFYVARFEAQGYRVVTRSEFEREKARQRTIDLNVQLRGVAKFYDFD